MSAKASRSLKLIAGVAFLVISNPGAVHSQPNSTQSPIVLQGETLERFANGCGVAVHPLRRGSLDLPPDLRGTYSDYNWTGSCIEGLAHGEGRITPVTPPSTSGVAEVLEDALRFSHGRYLSRRTIYRFTHSQRIGVNLHWLGPSGRVSVYSLDASPGVTNENLRLSDLSVLGVRSVYLFFSDGRGARAEIMQLGCETTGLLGLTQVPVRRCRDAGGVYAIYVDSGISRSTVTPCPDIRSAASCEAIWTEVTASIISDAVRISTELETPAAQAARLSQLESARQSVLAAQQRQELQEREERAFQTSLRTMNAGQLFNRADELARSGDAVRAEAMRRALIERFPNSPLAATAAQQLAGTNGSSGGGVQSVGSSSASARPSRRSLTCEDYLGGAFTAALNAGHPTRYGDNGFWVYSRLQYERLSNAIEACRADANWMRLMRQRVDEARADCRASNGSNCQSGYDDRPPQYGQATQRAFDETVARARADGSGQEQAGAARANQCARTPDQEVAAFDAEMGQVRARNPIPDVTAGTRAQYVWAASFGEESLRRIEPYRVCMAHRYEPLRNDLINVRDTAIRGCEATSSGVTGDCVRPMR